MTDVVPVFDFIVLIPCYNDKAGLLKSLGTVKYEGSKLMVLVVDDGSETPTATDEISAVLPPGTTIKVLRLSTNVGITQALNRGLNRIMEMNGVDFVSRYVARLDCGDLCAPQRFYRQVAFLEENNNIDLLGSWCVFENFETGDKFVYRTPTEDRKIKRAMYFRNIFIHPTVMWRTEIMKRRNVYPENFPHAEDYGLFYQWMDADVRTAVLPEKLVTCRINVKGLSLANRNGQLESRLKVIRTYGRNKLLMSLGVLKLWMLMAVPYSLVFRMKKLLAGNN